jgi:hypothetical protein
MTIQLQDDYEYFIAWRFIYDNYLRDEILNYKKA